MPRSHDEDDDNYGIGLPLTVIGGSILAICAYLAIGQTLLNTKPEKPRVFLAEQQMVVNRRN